MPSAPASRPRSARRSRPLRLALVALLVLAGAAAGACGARTTLSSVWVAPDHPGPFHRLLIIGVARTDVGRRSFEDHFAEALRARGVDATPSYRELPADRKLTEEEIARTVARREIGGVIVTRLVGVDKEQQYVPPTTTVYPYGGHGGLYGYYYGAYDVVTTPGYWRTITIVRLETRLYDASTGSLVWGAESDTFEPSSTDDIIQSVTKKITKQLADDGLIPR